MGFFGQQSLKSVEKLFLGALFIGEKLHVVDEQQVQRMVFVLEFLKGFALVGLDHVRHKLLGMDVQDLGRRLVGEQTIACSVH